MKDRTRENERERRERDACVTCKLAGNGGEGGRGGGTTTGIRPWTTNSLINQIPVCRTNGRANIEQPVSGTPRGIKVQGISEKRFFWRGRFHPRASADARRGNDFRLAGRGSTLSENLHATARRSQELFVDNQSVPRGRDAREWISSRFRE